MKIYDWHPSRFRDRELLGSTEPIKQRPFLTEVALELLSMTRQRPNLKKRERKSHETHYRQT
jgi:hypothetical protein